jgi:ribonuclease P protein component
VRSRHGALRVLYLADDDGVRVAYAIGRPTGTAVARNRLRRRLRAIVAGLDLPPGRYLIAAGDRAASLPFATLEAQVRGLVDGLRPR